MRSSHKHRLERNKPSKGTRRVLAVAVRLSATSTWYVSFCCLCGKRRAKRSIFVHILRLSIDNITTLAIMQDDDDLPDGTLLPMLFGPLVNDKLTAGIEAAISKWCIGEMVAGDRLLGGNRDESTMAPSSVRKYRVLLDQLRRFYTLIGSYESLLIMLNPKPRVCPSMDVSDVVLFMNYKYNVCGTTLMRNGAPVLDVLDRPVYCSGAWNAPWLARELCRRGWSHPQGTGTNRFVPRGLC